MNGGGVHAEGPQFECLVVTAPPGTVPDLTPRKPMSGHMAPAMVLWALRQPCFSSGVSFLQYSHKALIRQVFTTSDGCFPVRSPSSGGFGAGCV